MLVKHCPECREDYLPHIERCADCGATLVPRDDEAPLDDGTDRSAVLPPGEYHLLVLSDRAAELDPLVARLARADLPAKVTVARRGSGFELRVRDEDRPRALELLQDIVTVGADAALDHHFDAERGAYAACPACTTPLPAGVAECSECGLLLGGAAPTCGDCGAEIDPTAACCGACGHRLVHDA